MAKTTGRNVILLSIFPRFAHAILDGKKKVEFRKLAVKHGASHVVIYATSPQMKVVGFFRVKEVHRHSPRTLWEKFGRVGAISRCEFFRYYDGHDQAVCFEVGQVWTLQKPLPLKAVHHRLSPPQSFTYLPQKAWQKIQNCARLAV